MVILINFLTMQIMCLAARYVASPSLARAQIGPFTFSQIHVSQLSKCLHHLASWGAFSVFYQKGGTIGTECNNRPVHMDNSNKWCFTSKAHFQVTIFVQPMQCEPLHWFNTVNSCIHSVWVLPTEAQDAIFVQDSIDIYFPELIPSNMAHFLQGPSLLGLACALQRGHKRMIYSLISSDVGTQ